MRFDFRRAAWVIIASLAAHTAAGGCESTDRAVTSATSSGPSLSAGGSGGDGAVGSGAGGDSAVGAGGGGTPRLAATCATDAECGEGLKCYTATSKDWGGLGPAKGYCSADCSADATICKAFDPAALCYPIGDGHAFCLKGCSYGPDMYKTFDPAKCYGREEVSCASVVTFAGSQTNVTPACWPTCNSDADCGSGLWCDPGSGLCSSTPVQGKDIGAQCELHTGECLGICKPMLGPNGLAFTHTCFAYCTTGAVPNCGWSGPGDTPANAYCLTTLMPISEAGGPSAGDMGLCVQLCDCGSDCGNPDLVCIPWTSSQADMEPLLGRKGHCGSPYLQDGSTTPGITCG